MSVGSANGDWLQRFDPVRFNRACAILALALLTITVVGRFFMGWSDQDFPQYYMGGLMARLGEFDSLYPIPKPGSRHNAGYIEGSDMKPRYAQEASKRGLGEQARYIQPPPVALLLVPLSFLSYKHAYVLWMLALILCTWCIAIQAGALYRTCRGRTTHAAGLLTLLIAISPAAHRWIRVQNMSPIIGALIGAAVLGMVRNEPFRSALATWLGGVAKLVTGVFLPLYIAMRQWRALIWLFGIGMISIAVAVPIMGWGVFHEYLFKIAPTLKNTNMLITNQSIQGLIVRTTHGVIATQDQEEYLAQLGDRPLIAPNVMRVVTGAQSIVLVIVLWLIFRQWRRRPEVWRENAPLLCAAASALLCWLLIFSPIYWEHYTAYLAPLFGWLAWEATRSRAKRVVAIVVAGLLYVPWVTSFSRLPEPMASHILWATCLMFGLALHRLWQRPRAARVTAVG